MSGEFVGPSIQKNKLGLLKPDWYIFTSDFNGNRVGLNSLLDVSEELEVNHVPIVKIMTGAEFKDSYATADTLLEEVSNYRNDIYKNGVIEGFVIRPTEPVYSNTIGTDLSMKVINNEYLLSE